MGIGPCWSVPFSNPGQEIQSCYQGPIELVGQISFQLALSREILHQFEIAQDSRQLSQEEYWLQNNLKKHSLALASKG